MSKIFPKYTLKIGLCINGIVWCQENMFALSKLTLIEKFNEIFKSTWQSTLFLVAKFKSPQNKKLKLCMKKPHGEVLHKKGLRSRLSPVMENSRNNRKIQEISLKTKAKIVLVPALPEILPKIKKRGLNWRDLFLKKALRIINILRK